MRLLPLIYRFSPLALAAVLSVILFSVPAHAKEKELGTFGVWRAYSSEEGGQNVCYMTTMKVLGEGKNQRVRYLMITHRPTEGSSDVFSFGAGVQLDSKHGASLKIGKETFDLFSARDTAWAREAMTDHKIASALRTAKLASVSAIAAQGKAPTFTEQFSLTGAPQAYSAITKACGLPDPEIKAEVKKAATKKLEVKKAETKKTEAKNAAATLKNAAKKSPASASVKSKSATAKASAKRVTKKPEAKKNPAKKKLAKPTPRSAAQKSP